MDAHISDLTPSYHYFILFHCIVDLRSLRIRYSIFFWAWIGMAWHGMY